MNTENKKQIAPTIFTSMHLVFLKTESSKHLSIYEVKNLRRKITRLTKTNQKTRLAKVEEALRADVEYSVYAGLQNTERAILSIYSNITEDIE